jgi:5-methyltetrahydropteroyltriglutamate--homocysteine methyltransferase
MTQLIQTTVVGSYPVPEWLKTSPNPQTLRDAIRLVMDVQERAGIDVIGDGELGRWDLARREPAGMVERFVRPMQGVRMGLTRKQREVFLDDPVTAYRANAPGVVVGDLSDGDLDLLREYQQAKSLTDRPLKFTLTSPYMLAKVVADDHYHDLEQLTMAMADVLAGQMRSIDAAVIQIDEPHLPGYPEHGPLAAAAINRVLDAVEDGVRRAVHLCFGNFGGQMIQRGHYRKLIDFLNRLHCDHVVLETTRRAQPEIEELKDIDDRIGLGLGVVDVKDLQVESPNLVAERIEAHAEMFGVERLAFVHPDCGLQVLPRPVAEGKLCALVSGRDLVLGHSR